MFLAVFTLVAAIGAAPGQVQAPAAEAPQGVRPLPATICDLTVPAPQTQPPPGTGPILYTLMLCFQKQGGTPVVEANTYLYYIQLQSRVSKPGEKFWATYDDSVEQIIRDDFKRLWATNFLDDLSIETHDVRFDNGVVGKVVVYNMEERQRIRIVDYEGNEKVDQNKIEEIGRAH